MKKVLCKYCNRALKPIGDKRKNGKSGLKDWSTRCFHKKCWIIVNDQHDHNCWVNSPNKIKWAKKYNLRLHD